MANITITKYNGFLHGGDYNPEQWLKYPEILKQDIEYMKAAHCNTVTMGIFSWAFLEPEEGKYNFEYFEEIVQNLTDNGINIILATPSGARPGWMAQKYPEVLRVDKNGVKRQYGERHNHCPSSPVYRKKVADIDKKLAQRFKDNPNIILWHISNEFGGEFYCDLCQENFRKWLKNKYKTLDKLNHAWWTGFWSCHVTDWEQIDVVSWDSYPRWHISEGNDVTAYRSAFSHDLQRGFKGKPFLIMENTPSLTNWFDVCKLKRPGMHMLSSMQAVAHGSESVLYFQWRKGRGGCEKFHGAVADHDNSTESRVFKEVTEVGKNPERLDEILDTEVVSQVALIYDYKTKWALEVCQGFQNADKAYEETCMNHYYDNDDISGIAMEYASKQYQKDYQQHPAGYYSQPVLNSPAAVKEGEYVILKNSGMWRTYTWFLDNPTFDDAMDGFDLRVGIYSDSMSFSRGAEVCISQIKIYKLSTASRVKTENAVPEDHIGNIYFKGEEIQICADFSSDIYPMYNKADGRCPLNLRYTVKDSDGKTVFTAADKINIEPLETVEHTKKFRVDKFDIYTVDIEAYNTDKKLYSRLATEFSYVNTDKGKTVNKKAGVQIALPSTDDAQIAQLAKNYAGIKKEKWHWKK